MLKVSGRYRVKADHPGLNGHFPGNPIVPGVVILDYARELLVRHHQDWRVVGLKQAKFFRPLKPERTFTIHLIQTAPTLVRFECICVAEKLAAGVFIVEPPHV